MVFSCISWLGFHDDKSGLVPRDGQADSSRTGLSGITARHMLRVGAIAIA